MAWPTCGRRAVAAVPFSISVLLLIQVLLKERHAHIFKNVGNCEFSAHIPVMVLKDTVSSTGANVWKRSV